MLALLPMPVLAQSPVAPVTGWLATVDSATQLVELRWQPSVDSSILGYHICTGNPCLDYDTVFGRFDTNYICLDHSPLEQHIYRLHAFDSAYNVSELTPPFGNIVLQADIPECETTVDTRWTPYTGLPDRSPRYTLQVRFEPFHEGFNDYYTTVDSTALEYSFDIAESVTRMWLRVMATDGNGFRSLSNMVVVERRTIDTATVVDISDLLYDSIHGCNRLVLQVDTAFPYTLYRSIDGSPWRPIHTFQPTETLYHFSDCDINPYDSLHCYQLGVRDACGMNERYSATRWVVVPDPPDPGIALPNIIVAGDERNGTFRPVVRGLKGDLYQLDIYNRAGLSVYYTEDPEAGWTPDTKVPQGVYTYRLRCRYNNNDIKTYTGTLIIIK